jgi:hypothetical protein
VQVTGGVSEGESVTGQRTLTATANDDSGRVSKVEFYVSGALACADVTVRGSGAIFSCTWDSSTAFQGSYQLTAKAYDAAGNATESEPISFTTPPPNRSPSISEATATPPSIDERASTTLAVTASDPDEDELDYSWTQTPAAPKGTFTGTGANPTWTAPTVSADTVFKLQVTVSDGRGGAAQQTVDVAVANVPTLNRKPILEEINPLSASVIAGDTINLSIVATDPDEDTLTYSWTTEPAGQGNLTATGNTAQWRSSDVSAPTSYTLKVTVSDGTDSVTGTRLVEVGVPEYARDIQSIWNAQCTTCHNSSTGTRGGLNLDTGKSYASLVNVAAAGLPCGPTGIKRVVPNQPADSLVVKKISPNPVCGGRMPQLNEAYFDDHPGELTRIRSWILAGALNN